MSPVKQAREEPPEVIVEREKSKLQKLLAQPDIFDCLRRINMGLIRSYDDLDTNQAQQSVQNGARRGAGAISKDDADESGS